MNTADLKERFGELYENMAHSKDVSKMKHFGKTFATMFDKVAEVHPDMASAIVDMLSAIEYNNFVTKDEAIEVSSHFINDDMVTAGNPEPSKGAHWSMEDLKTFLDRGGLSLEEKPYFNWFALWLAVNMIYSDYADALGTLIGKTDNETMAVASYSLALKRLKDLDRPKFIREYFHLDA